MKQTRRKRILKLSKCFWKLWILLAVADLSAADYITLESGDADNIAWGAVTFEANFTNAAYTSGSPDITGTGIGTKYQVNDLVWEGANLRGYVVDIPNDNTITLNANPGNGTNKTLRGRMTVVPTEEKPGTKDNVFVAAGHTLTFSSAKEYNSLQILPDATTAGKVVVTDNGYLKTTSTGDDNQTYVTRVYGAYNGGEAQFVIEGTGEAVIEGFLTFRANDSGASSAMIVKDNGKLTVNRTFSCASGAVLKMSGTSKGVFYSIERSTVECSEGTPFISVKKRFAPESFTAGQSTVEIAAYEEETTVGMVDYVFYNLLVNNPITYSWGWATNAMIKTYTIQNNLTVNVPMSITPHKWIVDDGATISASSGFGVQAGIMKDGTGSISLRRSTPLNPGETLTIPFTDGKSKYTPVVITEWTPADAETAEVNIQTVPASNAIAGSNSLQRTWTLKTTGTTALSARFSYADGELVGDPQNYTVRLLETGSQVALTDVGGVVNDAEKQIEITGASSLNGILMAGESFPDEAPDGAYTKANGNWNSTSVWLWKGEGSGIPDGEDVDVYIGHTVSGTQDFTVRNFTIQQSGRFNASNGKNYTIKGKTDVYGIYNEEDNKNDAKTTFEGAVTLHEGAYMNTENVYSYDNGNAEGKAYDAAFRTQTRTPLIFKDDITINGEFRCGEIYFDADAKDDKTIVLRGTGEWIASGRNKRFILGTETTLINEMNIRFTSSSERFLQSISETNNSVFVNKGTIKTQVPISPNDMEMSSSKKGTPIKLLDLTSYENTFMFDNGGAVNLPCGEFWHYHMQTNSEMYGRTFAVNENVAIKGNMTIKGNPLAYTEVRFNANDLRIDVAGDLILENENARFSENSKSGCTVTANKIINKGGTLTLTRVAVEVKGDGNTGEPLVDLQGGAQFSSLYLSGQGDKKIHTDGLLKIGVGSWNTAQSDTSNLSISSGNLDIEGSVLLSGSSNQNAVWEEATNKPYIFANGGKIKITSLQINEGNTSNYPELRNVDLEVDTLKLSFNANYGRYMFYTGTNKLTINHDYVQMTQRADGSTEMMNATGGEVVINGNGPLTGTLRFAPAADGGANIRKLVINRTTEANDSIGLYDNLTVGEELQMNGQPLRFMGTGRTITYAAGARLVYGGVVAQQTGIEFDNAADITVNNAAGVKMSVGKAAAMQNITLQNGIFDVNDYDLNVQQITGSDFGAAKMIELGAKSLITPVGNKLLPIGAAGQYAPVTLSDVPDGTSADLTVSIINEPYANYAGEAIRLNKQWNISASGEFTGNLLMQYQPSDIEGAVENGKLEALYIAGDEIIRLGESKENKIETPYKGAGIYTARYMPLYTVTMTKGTAEPAQAYEDDEVTVTADQPEEGYAFRYWTSEDVLFADSSLSVTTFTMPAKNVMVTAEYALIRDITVTGGTADTVKAIIGDTVHITTHVPFGMTFEGWNSSNIEIDDPTAVETYFIMPDENVSVEARFANAIPQGKEWMLVDMENNMLDGTGYWKNWDWGGTLDRAFANPVKEGINTSETVYKYQQNDSGWGAVGFDMLVNTDSVDLSGWDYIAVDVMVEEGTYDGEQSYVRKSEPDQYALTRVGSLGFPAGQWNTLFFNLNSYPEGISKNIAGFFFKPNAGTPNSIIYIDNLRLLKTSSVTFAAGSENATSDLSEAVKGQTVTVTTPEPAIGKQFDGWQAEGVTFADSKALSTTFVMPEQDVVITAVYSDIVYNVNTEDCVADPAQAVMSQEVTLTPDEPEPGYEFDKWEVLEGEITIVDNKFTMPASSVSVKALYKKINYTVTVTGGTADKQTATIGEIVTLTPGEAELGYEFDKWEVVAGDVVVEENAFTMATSNVEIEAVYKKIEYTVTVTGGTADKTVATIGETVTLTPEIPDGLKLLGWTVEEGEITVAEDNTFVMPASNVKVVAEFNVGVEDGTMGELAVYPNPAEDYIKIEGLEANASYIIISANGAIVATGSDYNGEYIDISNLASGTYLLRSGDNTLRFIKK